MTFGTMAFHDALVYSCGIKKIFKCGLQQLFSNFVAVLRPVDYLISSIPIYKVLIHKSMESPLFYLPQWETGFYRIMKSHIHMDLELLLIHLFYHSSNIASFMCLILSCPAKTGGPELFIHLDIYIDLYLRAKLLHGVAHTQMDTNGYHMPLLFQN